MKNKIVISVGAVEELVLLELVIDTYEKNATNK